MAKNKIFSYCLGVSYFIHPIPLLAVSLLVLNDHYFKIYFHNWWTGKLSDFCGVFFLPLFICALYCLVINLWNEINKSGEFEWISRNKILTGILITDIILGALKLSPIVVSGYFSIMQALGIPVVVTLDPTDLFSLAMNWPTYIFARRYWKD